jgi:hypothetical protein
MIVASVNAKKRLGATGARERFRLWLERRGVSLVVVQEAWRTGGPVPPPLPGMQALEGDAELVAWIRDGLGRPRVDRCAEWWQTVLVGDLAIHSVHLDPYSAARRVAQLQILAERLPTADNVVLGDFNLAPRSVDGIYGTSPSRFTSGGERRAFAELLAAHGLADATASDPPEFTLSRRIGGSESSFRCDLALLPASWPKTGVMAAHETRTGPDAFTDHSGIIVRVNPTADRPTSRAVGQVNRGGERSAPGGGVRSDPTAAASFKTAIARRGPSAPATAVRQLIERILEDSGPDQSVRGVLDYGCGRGADVDYFRSLGMDAVGYDPHVLFGFAESPTGLFLVVTLIFVLNVLPTVEARLEVLRGAAARLAPDGVLIVATRSSAAVRNEAARRGWRAWGDGFVSHEGRGTFQHGMDAEEIVSLGEMLGLRSHWPLPIVRDAALVALTRPPPPTGSAQQTEPV